MNGCAGEFSMTRPSRAVRIACAAAGLVLAGWAGAALADPAPLPADVVAKAAHPDAYPKFSQIPALPKDVRTAAEWKAAVVRARLAGVHVQRLVENLPPAPDDTVEWAAAARAEATPPAPVTQPSEDTAALIAELRARASAPPRSK
jgi:hypothetical protein